MKSIKKIFATLSAISLLGVNNIGAVQFNQNQIVTGIDVKAVDKIENFYNELGIAYAYYKNVLRNNNIEDLLKGTQSCECNIQQLLYASRASHDNEAKTLTYYNHIITGQIGTSIVWANYFSKLLSNQEIENYILDISNGRYGSSMHIVAYKLNGQWYGISCYNSPERINGEEISDLSICLKNASRLYVDGMQVHVDANKCPYFRNLDILRFTKEELDNYEYDGIYVKISRELITDGNWNNIKDRLMNIIDQCHNPVYLRTIHPVYLMKYDL